MIRPPRASASYYQQPSRHARRPAGPRIGEAAAQPQESSLTTISNKAAHFMNWLTGNAPVPAYKSLSKEDALDALTIECIEDLRTVLINHKPSHGEWKLMVQDRLNKPAKMAPEEQRRKTGHLIQNGATEFFLALEDGANLPEYIIKKYDHSSVLGGISFIVPTRLLPQDFHSNNKKDIKNWLGLDPDVSFQLWGNRKRDVIA